jgi:hypothetical protein
MHSVALLKISFYCRVGGTNSEHRAFNRSIKKKNLNSIEWYNVFWGLKLSVIWTFQDSGEKCFRSFVLVHH